MWGSDVERAQCRRQAFAYQARFGQHTLIVTLTPNIADSFVMAQYCGISSVGKLFDAALAERTNKSALYSASMRNDPASARLFVQNIEAFIEHVLGVSPKHMKAKPFDGLFGPVLAYFGMELPIPPEAYEDPKKQHGGGRPRGEPELLHYSGCGNNLSSQHVFRRLLLDSRPAAWPPSLRPYTSAELEDAVQLEARHRGGVRAAKAAIYRRDLCLSTREHEGADCDEYGEYLRGLSRTRFHVEHCEDDAFQQDHVARALMTLPPSPDDARWPARCIAFAVSMLVFMLSLHWWSHAGSCFNNSSTAAPGQCHYNFPRARAARTSCSSDGVTLARRAPFEFVNGFNTEIMLAYKSNHDIQVMIGGLGALLRIFYATKYVIKMQEHIDSITAVALAAFRRRQLREARDEEAVANTDCATIVRWRVASLLYAITNRREITGPLAALYVQRGSCAFMSTPCATFRLRVILHELTDQVAHLCDLVELRGCDSSVTFRAASFLDNYSYRSPGLDYLNLY
ncbi:hypothetical protein PF008_g16654 [Phytophthora fragariae]|uniref:Helitron helicase-like domain-containing protein n=1 Tax=Phytophthora fragariae TaxID=53985 RepID=A0A6G0RAM1_9STRA|nr:hypothetical protein PF008_g16654 [Phytophthora fragariae]